jgi:hypothetical protein
LPSICLRAPSVQRPCTSCLNAGFIVQVCHILGTCQNTMGRACCYATSLEHALKDWLLCNLLGAWSSMH